jgi:hypothetical protein
MLQATGDGRSNYAGIQTSAPCRRKMARTPTAPYKCSRSRYYAVPERVLGGLYYSDVNYTCGTDPSFITVDGSLNDVYDTSASLIDLTPDTVYYFKIIPYNIQGDMERLLRI